jgi:hypothetical protein
VSMINSYVAQIIVKNGRQIKATHGQRGIMNERIRTAAIRLRHFRFGFWKILGT